MEVKIYHYNKDEVNGKIVHDTTPIYLGYAEVDKFDLSEIHRLCNWECWSKEKPSNLHANIGYCDHGLLILDPETQERWLSKSIGWLTGTEDEINKYVLDNRYNILWR